ncbi:MAG: hypothetical protein LBD13_07130, partial [Spirochaetaceae bacterium]|nr:hypothetical protein [Spirochaetaceae bacterium]
ETQAPSQTPSPFWVFHNARSHNIPSLFSLSLYFTPPPVISRGSYTSSPLKVFSGLFQQLFFAPFVFLHLAVHIHFVEYRAYQYCPRFGGEYALHPAARVASIQHFYREARLCRYASF